MTSDVLLYRDTFGMMHRYSCVIPFLIESMSYSAKVCGRNIIIEVVFSEDDTEEHFAGFLSKAADRNVDDETEHPKSKKEAIAEVVTNSKIQKVVTL